MSELANYYFNERGTFVHVPCEIKHHMYRGEYSHTSVHFCCGNNGFLSKDRPAKLYEVPPSGKPLCQKCLIASRQKEIVEMEPELPRDADDVGRPEKTVTITLSTLAEFRLSFPYPATPAEHAEFLSKLRELKPGMAPKKSK